MANFAISYASLVLNNSKVHKNMLFSLPKNASVFVLSSEYQKWNHPITMPFCLLLLRLSTPV